MMSCTLFISSERNKSMRTILKAEMMLAQQSSAILQTAQA
jgi:hypothetical protein